MNETAQDRVVVLAVVFLLGVFGIVGLAGIIWLVHDRSDPAAVAVVSTLTGAAIGGLTALLAGTRTAQPMIAAAQGAGYKQAVADVQALDPAVEQTQPTQAQTPSAPVANTPPLSAP